MSMTAYVGQGGNIEIKKENVGAMVEHLRSLGEEFAKGEDVHDVCANFGIELSMTKDGDIVDAYPNSLNWSSNYEEKFYEEIAPFVEDGSYQTFYCEGFLFSYVYRGGEVDEVSLDDLAKAIAEEPVLTCSNPACGRNRWPVGKLKYRWPDPLVVDRVSPGDTVPQGICPNCNSLVYQNETEVVGWHP